MMMDEKELERIAELVAAKAPTTFLSSSEVSELTGRRTHKLQIETLRKQGVPFFLNAAGRPVVPRSAIDGKTVASPGPSKRAWTPPD
jgi:hypothetical protein